MRSAELADEVEDLIRECQSRVLTIGDEQYSEGDNQKFEDMPLDELFIWLNEELQDAVNYLTMLYIRLRRARHIATDKRMSAASWEALAQTTTA